VKTVTLLVLFQGGDVCTCWQVCFDDSGSFFMSSLHGDVMPHSSASSFVQLIALSKTVGRITYIVLVQTLNHAQSINQLQFQRHCAIILLHLFDSLVFCECWFSAVPACVFVYTRFMCSDVDYYKSLYVW